MRFLHRCVAFNEETIVSGSWDNTIKVWSTKTGKLKNTLDGHDGRVLHLDFDQNKIVRSLLHSLLFSPAFVSHSLLPHSGERFGRQDRARVVGLRSHGGPSYHLLATHASGTNLPCPIQR